LILIVSAIKLEVFAILKRMKKVKILNKRIPSVHEGYINNKKIILVISGVGKDNASVASEFISSKFLENAPGENNKGHILERIIICGVSGALKEELTTGDVIVCNKISLGDLNSCKISNSMKLRNSEKALEKEVEKALVLNNSFFGKKLESETRENKLYFKLFFSGSLLTVNNILADVEEKKLAGERFGADIADMESYWILKNLTYSKIKTNVLCIRAVSDGLNFSLTESLQNLIRNGNINYHQVFLFILKNSMNFFRLISAGINFRKACRSLHFFIENICKF